MVAEERGAKTMVLAEDSKIERYTEDSERSLNAFSSASSFETAQRMARALASSSLVPEAYKNNIPNTLIAMELANRIGVSVLMTMQSLDIIHGRPSWRASFLIATVNQCGRFTPLRFRWVGERGKDTWGCSAVAKDRATSEECEGSTITIGMAKAEGWFQKNGSKWKTMPDQMCMYRAASFWARVYSPELSLGMTTSEEAIDTWGEPRGDVVTPAAIAPGSTEALEEALRATEPVEVAAPSSPEPESQPMREPGEEG